MLNYLIANGRLFAIQVHMLFLINCRVDNVVYSREQQNSLENPYILKHSEEKEEFQ